MIVERKWATERWTHDRSNKLVIIKSQWVGWFLFGFVPLFIKQTYRATT